MGAGSVWDIVDAEYDSMGRVVKQSRPYRSGSPNWTNVSYDALSRTKKVIAPDYTLPDASDGSTTETFYNEATRPSIASSLPGETTRVRDAWGRERWGRTDAQGRLVEVVEPNPAGSGSVFDSGALLTTYAYNTLGNLVQVTQDAQTRSFKYDSLGRLLAQKLAETSATLNDAGAYQSGGGTWSDVFTYDDRSNLTSRTDARGVKAVYSYNNDPLNRLQSVAWDTNGFGDSTNPILAAATVSYQYRTKNSPTDLKDITQPAIVTTSGVSTETYDFDFEGRVNFKRLVVNGRPAMDTNYTYDNLDRVTDVDYPAKNLVTPAGTRPHVHQDYDLASRLTSLTIDGAVHASNIVYNAASQTTSLSVGTGTNQISESYNYDSQTGLLTGQTVARSSSPTSYLLNLAYDYVGANGKRTGQLTKILNNRDHNKDRSYTYDMLGRLTQAQGGPSGSQWTQSYSYDKYGNRTAVSASGTTAKAGSAAPGTAGGSPAMSAKREAAGSQPEALPGGSSAAIAQPSDPQVSLPTDQVTSKTDIELPNSRHTDAPRVASNSHHASRSAPASPSSPIPVDGHANLSYDPATNRINSAGFAYDAAGNQIRALIAGGASQWFQYDAANRLVRVRAADNQTVIASYTYGDSNERLIVEEGSLRTYYACDGSMEYTESGGSTTPQWSKTYIYLGARLLSTLTPNGSGGQLVQYHHPDRLGTRLVTNAQDTNYFEQQTLPFGTALNESPPAGGTTGATNKRFTTYDRSLNTGLDYAINRHYDPQQGRFTQVDPIGMDSVSLASPQTLNLHAYCANDPINQTDPGGLGFISFLKNVFGKVVHALKAALAAFVFAFVSTGGDFSKGRSAAVKAFVSDFGFSVRTGRVTGTAPTFPRGRAGSRGGPNDLRPNGE